ncbi:hypothetical protein QBC44DRAFT_402085 [Cladorrhinum sp. PSN332]|nr:hypothetical protein QBC44DRAFT_402085 [Cladorrhinum sp. PSN332]
MADGNTGWIGGRGDALYHLGISFIGEDNCISWRNALVEDQKRTEEYLGERFGVYTYTRNGPFLVLGFDKDVAGPGDLPYSVGGYVPVWCGDGDLDFHAVIGAMGLAEPEPLDIFISEQVDFSQGPTPAQVVKLADTAFTEAEAFTFISGTLIVELPESDEDEFLTKVSKMPVFYERFPRPVQWHNGPLVQEEARRREM